MILADTSVWIDHLRRGEPELAALLRDGGVLMHPLVAQELACGGMPRRGEILGLLRALPAAPLASHAEVLDFIEDHRLFGTGIGAADAHLLASCRLASARLWTRDAALDRAAGRLKLRPV